MRGGFKGLLEYALARLLLATFGSMPRRIAYPAARVFARLAFHLARRQRRAGMQNLRLAMPELSQRDRVRILHGSFQNLGRLLVEFSHFPGLNKSNLSEFVFYDGLENYLQALQRRRGVIFLTAHFGAWELSSFAHSVYGHPMKFVARPIDNPRVEELIFKYRTRAGNSPIRRRNASREILKALRDNHAVGILFDQNTTREEGVFVNFFGIPAATTTAVAAFALRTGAAVMPGFLIWEESLKKHRLRFDPPLQLVETGDRARDLIENTQLFNNVLEDYVRRYPDQWLWIHRRWKTRPEGEDSLY